MKRLIENIFIKMCILTISTVLLCLLSGVAFADGDFMWGVGQIYEKDQDGAYTHFDIDEIKGLGAPWYRAYVIWNEIEPEIYEKEVDLGHLDELIEEYQNKNFESTDSMVDQLVGSGIEPFLVIGAGFDDLLPTYSGEVANPRVLGPPNYISHLYLHTRAVVRRYRDRVHYWQMESYLNEARIALMKGQRSGFPWGKWDFLSSVMRAIRDGIKTEDPDAIITTALYTDVPDELHKRTGTKTWREALVDWWGYIDIIALASYPNNVEGVPVLGELVGQRVTQAIPLARGRQVIVIDSGYASGPSPSYTEANQSLFIEEATDTAISNGASGFFYSTLYSCDCGSKPTLPENYWGLIGPAGKKQAWDTYYSIINPSLAFNAPLKSTLRDSDFPQQTTPLPYRTVLLSNYPNPFNPETWLPYELAKDANVIINIYDAHGRLIRTLPLGKKLSGTYIRKNKAAYWDGKDNLGQSVASGVYFYTLHAGDFSATRKMLIVK